MCVGGGGRGGGGGELRVATCEKVLMTLLHLIILFIS